MTKRPDDGKQQEKRDAARAVHDFRSRPVNVPELVPKWSASTPKFCSMDSSVGRRHALGILFRIPRLAVLEAAASKQQRKVGKCGVRACSHAAAKEYHRVIEQIAAVDRSGCAQQVEKVRHLRGHIGLDLHQRTGVTIAITVCESCGNRHSARSRHSRNQTQRDRARGVSRDRQRDQLHHRLEIHCRTLALRWLGMIGLRLGRSTHGSLQDLFLQRPHRVEVLLKLVLILLTELAFTAFACSNTTSKILPCSLNCCRCQPWPAGSSRNNPVGLLQINRRHLHTRAEA